MSNPFRERRVGRFAIHKDVIETNFEDYLAITKDIAIVSCTFGFDSEQFIITGYSRHFDTVITLVEVPDYKFRCMYDKAKIASIRWEKVK